MFVIFLMQKKEIGGRGRGSGGERGVVPKMFFCTSLISSGLVVFVTEERTTALVSLSQNVCKLIPSAEHEMDVFNFINLVHKSK